MQFRIALLALVVVLAGCAGPGVDGPAGRTASPSVSATPPPEAATVEPSETGTPNPAPNGTLAVHFVNVGQATAVLVVGPTGETMLVDSGGYRDDGADVLAYLDRLGVDRIDYLVTSHADADHIGGHAAVVEHFETAGEGVGAVYDPGYPASTLTYEDYLDAVERHDVALYETRAGDRIPLEGATVRVLAPPAGGLAGGDRNENSLVLLVEFGATSVLLTGDAGPQAEAYLVERYGDALDATVLKAGHHGSETSTGTALLSAADPAVVVVSSAYDSPFGHPDPETLSRLANRSIPTFWTAVHGDVVARSNGTAVTVLTREPAPTAPLALRSATGVLPGSGGDLAVRAVIPAGERPTPVGTPAGTPTPGTSTTNTPGLSTPTPSVDLGLAEVHADAAGDDRSNLNDEYVVLRNAGDSTLDLSGWTVRDAAGHEFVVPEGTTLAPGATVTLHTGSGEHAASDLYWNASGPVWNNGGDTVTVTTDGGRVVVEASY